MIFLSPGVKTEEVDMSTYAARQSTCIVGIVGAGRKGVIGEPTYITSIPELLETFGAALMDDYAIIAAAEFLKQGNQLYFTRLAESSVAAAEAELLKGALVFRAKELGTNGNGLAIQVRDSDGSKAWVDVYVGDNLMESHEFTLNSQDENFVENISSDFIEAEFVEEITSIPQIVWMHEAFVEKEKNKFYLTGKDSLRDGLTFDFSTLVDSTVSSFNVKSDSFGIVTPDTPAGTWVSNGADTTVTLDDAAKVVIPEAMISGLRVNLVKVLEDETEATYNAAFSEKFVEVLPYSEGNRGPLEGNPWLVVDFETAAPGAQVKFSVYKKDDTTKALTLEMQTAEGSSARRIFRNGGANFQSFEVLKSRPTADSLNFDPTKDQPGKYVLRMELEQDGYPVQILEKEFDIKVEDLKAEIKKAEPVLNKPTIKALPSQSTKEGLRVISYTMQILSPLNKALGVEFVVKPDEENIVPITNTDAPEYIPLQISNTVRTALSGGNDGTPLRANTVVQGLQIYRSPENVDLNLIAAPGFWQDSVVVELLDIASSRGDCMALVDPPQGLSFQDVVNWHNGRLEGDQYPKRPLDTSYGALYHSWVEVNNPSTGNPVWCPPSGVVLAVYAYNDAVGQPWFAPAGLNRGMLPSVLRLEKTPNEGHRDLMYGNSNAVNPLTNYKQLGLTVWGQKTLQRKPSALDRVNVRRLMNYIRKVVAQSTAYLVFEQNDPLLWRQWLGIIEPVMDNVKNSRGLYDYKCVMDETTVTPFYQDRNEMPGLIYVKPTKTAEFIPISFILKSTGASFEE